MYRSLKKNMVTKLDKNVTILSKNVRTVRFVGITQYNTMSKVCIILCRTC